MRPITLTVALSLVIVGTMPVAGWAEALITPTVSATERYDDNIFRASRDRVSDLITQLSVGVGVVYRAEALSILGAVAGTGQIFAKNPDQNNFENGAGNVSAQYVPIPRLRLGLSASVTQTVDPGHFAVLTGPPATGVPPSVTDPSGAPSAAPVPPTGGAAVPGGAPPTGPSQGTGPPAATGTTTVPGVNTSRQRTLAAQISPDLSYQIDAATSLEAGYVFTHLDSIAGVQRKKDDEHLFSLGLSHMFGPRDTGALTYAFTYFPDANQGAQGNGSDTVQPDTIQTVLVSWTRRVTDALTVSLGVGPSIASGGQADVAALASINYRLRDATLLLAYARTTTLVLGRSGPQATDTVTAGLNYWAMRDLRFELLASYSRIASRGGSVGSSGASDATYGVSASASYVINRWMTARVAYIFSSEEMGGDSFPDNQVVVGLDMSYPYRFR